MPVAPGVVPAQAIVGPGTPLLTDGDHYPVRGKRMGIDGDQLSVLAHHTRCRMHGQFTGSQDLPIQPGHGVVNPLWPKLAHSGAMPSVSQNTLICETQHVLVKHYRNEVAISTKVNAFPYLCLDI